MLLMLLRPTFPCRSQLLAVFGNGRIEEFLHMRPLEVRAGRVSLPGDRCWSRSAAGAPRLSPGRTSPPHLPPTSAPTPCVCAHAPRKPLELADPAFVPAIAATLRRFHDMPVKVRP